MSSVEHEEEPGLSVDDRIAVQRLVRHRLQQLVEPFEVRSASTTAQADVGVGRRYHAVDLPCLIDQVRAAAIGSRGAAGATGGFDSRPPGPTDAIDVEIRIQVEAARFVKRELRATSTSLKGDLRLLERRVPTLTDDDLEELDRLVRSWWVAAKVVGGLEAPALAPHVRCPLCEHQDTIRVRDLDVVHHTGVAWCKDCGKAWDRSTIGMLITMIREALADPDPEEEPDGD